jgi:NAD(P)-dependent dehydrogenase (short-subunit alcohol dehydrogenase family)
MSKLASKVAVITGGNSGIGLASAKLFATEGAQVIITGRRKDLVDQAAAEIGYGTLAVAGDVSNLDDLDRLYQEIGRRFGGLDIIFANAGFMNIAPISAVTPEQFDREFNTNVRGLYFTVQKALPLLRNGGSIILNSSVANHTGSPGFSLYGGAKAAVRAFARSWSNDLKDRNIRVNSLSPGLIETPMAGKIGVPLETITANLPAMLARMPLGRLGRPQEVASAVLFLASDDSSFVTGIDLGVAGGLGEV